MLKMSGARTHPKGMPAILFLAIVHLGESLIVDHQYENWPVQRSCVNRQKDPAIVAPPPASWAMQENQYRLQLKALCALCARTWGNANHAYIA